jgi:hypothetical protein
MAYAPGESGGTVNNEVGEGSNHLEGKSTSVVGLGNEKTIPGPLAEI